MMPCRIVVGSAGSPEVSGAFRRKRSGNSPLLRDCRPLRPPGETRSLRARFRKAGWTLPGKSAVALRTDSASWIWARSFTSGARTGGKTGARMGHLVGQAAEAPGATRFAGPHLRREVACRRTTAIPITGSASRETPKTIWPTEPPKPEHPLSRRSEGAWWGNVTKYRTRLLDESMVAFVSAARPQMANRWKA